MNPPRGRAPSRFVRGRARGGGAYRPYFYFRRNGQTIPAGRGGIARDEGQPNRFIRERRGNGGRGAVATTNATRPNNDAAVLDSTFLRPEHYAAPDDALQIQSLAVETPVQCPGWSLYFNNETYAESSDLAKRIKIVEAHFSNNVAYYDLMKIQRKCYFKLQAKLVTSDEILQKTWPTLVQDFQIHPLRTLATFGAAMYAAVTMATIDASLSQPACSRSLYVPRCTRPRKIYVRPIGFMSANMISRLSSAEVDTLYCLRGSVASIGAVEASASWITYKCSRCCQEQALKQSGFFVSRAYSCKRSGCLAKKGFIEQRSSPFTRITPTQIIRLAENNLQTLVDFNAKLPEYLDIELRHDLVDAVASGQEIIVTGVLKMRPLAAEEQQSGYQSNSSAAQIYLKAASIVDAQHINPGFSQRDLDAIAMINAEPDSLKLLVHSLAPEIHGQELVKAGVLLSLFGGAGSQLHDDAEINVLLVGDPGLGKSQILQMCAKISEKGFLVSGKRGAAAVNNQLAASIKGRIHHNIDTGALIFANNGHCSIDDIDRLASQQETLLQVMQSKIISLPFPSTYATLTTPTTIIATANSLRGHYDQSKLLTENIRIHPALLRQFHLIFLLLDKPNKDLDTSLTEHIKALHSGAKKSSTIAARFAAKPKTNHSMNMSLIDVDAENDENYDLGERLKLKWLNAFEEEELDLLPPLLIKKFIAYARMQVKPLLNAAAAEMLKSFYMDLRSQQNEDKYSAVSTSQLEGLIRLTQARARIDFSSEATKAHVRDVLCIVRQSLADTSIDNYMDTNPATAASSQNSMVKKFIQILQLRSNAVGRRIFDFDELKDMARHAGISCGVTNLVDIINLQGFLLKKGPNLYEVMLD